MRVFKYEELYLKSCNIRKVENQNKPKIKASLGINSAGMQQDTSSLMHVEHLNSAMICGVPAVPVYMGALSS